MADSFRGWVRPGPIPPGAAHLPEVPPDETLDYISGHFRLFQLRDGHRFSTDDVLTAWYGTSWCPTASTILDLGSGIGSVATIAAWRLPGARLVTIEAQDVSVALARKSARFNGLDERSDIRHADFRQRGAIADRRAVRPRARKPAVFRAWQRDRGRTPAEDRLSLRGARRHRRLLSRGGGPSCCRWLLRLRVPAAGRPARPHTGGSRGSEPRHRADAPGDLSRRQASR